MSIKSIDARRLTAALLLMAVSFFFLHEGTEARNELSKLPAGFQQAMPETVGPASLLGVMAGMRSAASDWTYVDALQYIGDFKNKEDGGYRKSYPLYREVLWCDPYFHFAVLEGASFLALFAHRNAEARKLLEEAMRVDSLFPRYRLYYAAMAYKEDDPKERAPMLEILEAEAAKPGAPEMLMRAVGNIILKYGKREEALSYWRDLLGKAKEKVTTDMAERTLAKLGGL
jgi:hypothetical protein